MQAPTLMILNVLGPDYYCDCFIKGSITIPLETLEAFAINLDKETPIVIYSASYTIPVTVEATNLLSSLGFRKLWAYKGGISEWYYAKLPVVGSCSKVGVAERIRGITTHNTQVREITTEELHKMMEEYGLL